MKLQELIQKTSLDMTENQVKAFFLGVLCSEKPLNYSAALTELTSEAPEDRSVLEKELKVIWDGLSSNIVGGLEHMFPENSDLKEYLETSKEQLDYFLTALSLSGTNTENCANEDLAELIDELEDTVMDLDEYLTDEGTQQDGEDFKEFLLETWKEFLDTKRSN